MAGVSVSSSIRISVPVGDQKVTFVCRRPSAQELSRFLNSRFTNHRNKMKSRLYEARAEFFDAIARDAENVTYETADGAQAALSAQTVLSDADRAKWTAIIGAPVTNWKDLISVSWKSAVAMRFEDAGNADGDDEGEEKN